MSKRISTMRKGSLFVMLAFGVLLIFVGVMFNVRMGVLFWLLNALLVLIWNFNRFASE